MLFFQKKSDEKFQQDYTEAQKLFYQLKMRKCQAILEPWSKRGYAEATALLCRINRIAHSMVKEGKKKDEFSQKILHYLERGAKQGDANASFRLGVIYEFPNDLGVTTDIKRALKYYESSAEQEYGPALNNLGCLYQFGNGVERDFAKAKELYHRAATAGEPRGYLSLAYIYLWGKGVQPDLHMVEEYIYMAKNATDAQLSLAKAENKQEEVSQCNQTLEDITKCQNYLDAERQSMEYRFEDGNDKEKMFQELLKRAMNGDGRAQFELGRYYNDQKDYSKARKWFTKSAEKGFAGAVASIGLHYYYGQGVTKDFQQAFLHFERAEKMTGNKVAMKMLGKMYENGEYVETDYEKAASWYEKAAAQGEASAAGCLGIFYEEGRKDIRQDYEKAAKLYQQGADAGIMFCESRLAHLYATGKGVAQNYNMAIDLFNRAADKGSAYSKKRLEEIYAERRQQY